MGLLDTEHELITSLAKTFACSDNLAKELFIKLAAALRKWTTTSRANEKIFIEDVYSILGAESEPDLSPHRLAPPFPFFESRKAFSARLEKQLRETNKKVVFISGNPGAGKTSIISHLQAEFNLFFLRYYRQPILFRWLCNSEWLKETLCKHNLHLRYVSRLESIP